MELVINKITKEFKKNIAVDRITLTLGKGVNGLLGANGAGKTTLMRMMTGVLRPTAGTISYNGIDVSQREYRDILGYLPQDFGYYPSFTGYDFLMYISSIKGIPKTLAKAKVKSLMKELSLIDIKDNKISTYSGGMKQRLGIAQSLLNNPSILILDEPFAGLDPKERVNFRKLISELGNDRIILISTHIVGDIESIADNILMMKDGSLLLSGGPDSILGTIENKVFEAELSDSALSILPNDYAIINLKKSKGINRIRFIAKETPDISCTKMSPTLEDLYLYYFMEEV